MWQRLANHLDETDGMVDAETHHHGKREEACIPVDDFFPDNSRELDRWRRELAPEQPKAWSAFSNATFAAGALDEKTKQLIAIAVGHATQYPWCIAGHTKGAAKAGATPDEIMEAIWVAAEMRSGGAYAHSTYALRTLEDEKQREREAAD